MPSINCVEWNSFRAVSRGKAKPTPLYYNDGKAQYLASGLRHKADIVGTIRRQGSAAGRNSKFAVRPAGRPVERLAGVEPRGGLGALQRPGRVGRDQGGLPAAEDNFIGGDARGKRPEAAERAGQPENVPVRVPVGGPVCVAARGDQQHAGAVHAVLRETAAEPAGGAVLPEVSETDQPDAADGPVDVHPATAAVPAEVAAGGRGVRVGRGLSEPPDEVLVPVYEHADVRAVGAAAHPAASAEPEAEAADRGPVCEELLPGEVQRAVADRPGHTKTAAGAAGPERVGTAAFSAVHALRAVGDVRGYEAAHLGFRAVEPGEEHVG